MQCASFSYSKGLLYLVTLATQVLMHKQSQQHQTFYSRDGFWQSGVRGYTRDITIPTKSSRWLLIGLNQRTYFVAVDNFLHCLDVIYISADMRRIYILPSGLFYFHQISDNQMAGTPLKNLCMFEAVKAEYKPESGRNITTSGGCARGDVV